MMSNGPSPAKDPPVIYDDAVVRQFAFMTVIWGSVGMTVGDSL